MPRGRPPKAVATSFESLAQVTQPEPEPTLITTPRSHIPEIPETGGVIPLPDDDMARTPVAFAALHAPHFHLSGINLSDKLDTRSRPQMKLEWEDDRERLYVMWDGVEMMVPAVNIKAIAFTAPPKVNPVTTPVVMPGHRVTAQVGTPQSHVFAGAGHGKR